jgi:hypothetical protein
MPVNISGAGWQGVGALLVHVVVSDSNVFIVFPFLNCVLVSGACYGHEAEIFHTIFRDVKEAVTGPVWADESSVQAVVMTDVIHLPYRACFVTK